jgi:ornithine decarboxylase
VASFTISPYCADKQSRFLHGFNTSDNAENTRSPLHLQEKLPIKSLTFENNSIKKSTTKLDLTIPPFASRSVCDILHSNVTNLIDYDSEDPFYVADLAQVARQYQDWKELLPRVDPFYAVKCNPNEMVVKTLYGLGSGFDCASKAEIQQALDTGISPSRIIYANPCKQVSHIRYAASQDVSMMTFDNEDELLKVKMHHPSAKLILRILTDDSKSTCRFGVKFGASLAIVPKLLAVAKELDLKVIGISFHVGSGCFDASSFKDAVVLAREAFDIGQYHGFRFTLLDIGGGFPGRSSSGLQFSDIAHLIRPLIDELFPAYVRVIAEPGRYMVSNAFTLAVNIIARRVVQSKPTDDSGGHSDPGFMYYINDGMYGSFNCITFDHAVVYPKPLLRSGVFIPPNSVKAKSSIREYSCSVWGPTCDSIDCMGRDMMLPEMDVGDFLVFENMGAYTMAAASNFNGFKKSSIVYTQSRLGI